MYIISRILVSFFFTNVFDFLTILKVGVNVLAPNLFTANSSACEFSHYSLNIMPSCSHDDLKLCICG